MAIKEKSEADAKIGDAIRALMAKSDTYNQKELAERMGIAPATLSQMFSGVAPLAIERFFQILAILNPQKDDLEHLFMLYRSKLAFARNTQLLFIPKESLTIEQQRELEIIRLWIDASRSELFSQSPVVDNAVEDLVVYARKLTGEESIKALSILKTIFGER